MGASWRVYLKGKGELKWLVPIISNLFTVPGGFLDTGDAIAAAPGLYSLRVDRSKSNEEKMFREGYDKNNNNKMMGYSAAEDWKILRQQIGGRI